MFAAAALSLAVAAFAGQSTPKAVTVKGGENGMVGIKLYDTGARLISVYGNPTEIQPVSFGGGGIGPAGGAGGGGPMGAPGRGGGGGGGGGALAPELSNNPFGFGDDMLMFQRGGSGAPAKGGLGDAGGGAPMQGPGAGALGPPPGVLPPGAAPGRGPMAGGGMGGGNTNAGRITYTRWVYKRGTSKYGFILDKFNRVVQIEAVGLSDGKVRTSKGIHFGSTFGDIIKKYQTPDGYEINGDNIVVRYLVRNKVAFRLSRLGPNKPHTVTGIVVAGGKT